MFKSIGIIGGMGPAATCDLMSKIINKTESPDDQHHIHIYVDCNTNIPDRTAAIIGDGENPVPEMVKSAVKLQAMGADFLIMSCNTAHYFYDEIVSYIDIPLLHMPHETARELAARKIKKAGVLATKGTIQSDIYGKALMAHGIMPVYPDQKQQELLMSLIYDYVKKGIVDVSKYPVHEVKRMLMDMYAAGAETLILACTELPIAFKIMDLDKNVVDPTDVLARAAIREAGARTTLKAAS